MMSMMTGLCKLKGLRRSEAAPLMSVKSGVRVAVLCSFVLARRWLAMGAHPRDADAASRLGMSLGRGRRQTAEFYPIYPKRLRKTGWGDKVYPNHPAQKSVKRKIILSILSIHPS